MTELFVGATLLGLGFLLGIYTQNGIVKELRSLLESERDRNKLAVEGLVSVRKKQEGVIDRMPSKIEAIGDPPQDLLDFCSMWPNGSQMLRECKKSVLGGRSWEDAFAELKESLERLNA